MPAYKTPSGLSCTADEALSGGRLKPGYSEIALDGEYLHFGSTLMRDSAPASRSSVFLTDTPATEAQALADSIANLNAWRAARGSNTRVTDSEARSLALGQQIARDHAAKTAANNATIGQMLADQEAAYQATKPALNAWRNGKAFRDAARRHRYGS